MNVAIAQLEVEPAAIEANIERARTAIAEAATEGAGLVVLPELFNVGYFAFDAYARCAESLAGPTLAHIRETAVENDVAVLAGTIVEDLSATVDRTDVSTPASDGLANTAVLFDAEGTRQLVYRKHHLFGYGSAEQDLLTPGERLPTTDLGGLTVGVTTCYDVRFPELYRRLADQGVDLVGMPSAWPYPRVEHWQTLPKARAIENLCYLVAANGVGTFEDAALLGRSAVYDPWGTTLASAGDEATLLSATVDPERAAAVREEFPALADRRR